MKNSKNLTRLERERIYVMRDYGKSLREIAKHIGRSHSTVSKELSRNKAPRRQVFNSAYARAQYAHELAEGRRHQPKYRQRLKNPLIRQFVEQHLKDKRLPRDISIRLSKCFPEYGISAEAIYQWIYAERGDLTVELARRGKRRNRANKRGKRYLNPAAKKTSIAERPSVVTERSRFGDWEGDTIISRQSKFCIFTLVERKSRFTMLHLLPACNAQSALQALLESFYQLPPQLRKTLTLDNGAENSCHDKLALKTALDIYFCDAYASWQRGTVENTNGFIRRHFPKKTDFALVSKSNVKYVQDWLNTRMMDCLGGNSPAEIFLPQLDRYPNQIQKLFPHLGDIKQSFRIAA